MSVTIGSADFCVNRVFTMEFRDVPAAVKEHLTRCGDTVAIEDSGARMFAAGRPRQNIKNFVKAVCEWGGKIGSFIKTLVLNNNSENSIADCLEQAGQAKRPSTALSAVTRLRWLSTAFGSKHLRMLAPQKYVVLDRILSARLHYSLSGYGYEAICNDCNLIAAALAQRKIVNPVDDAYSRNKCSNPRKCDTTWWPADVEMALFAEAQNWSQKGCWATGDDKPTPSHNTGRSRISQSSSASSVPSFGDFWSWLQSERSAPTLVRDSRVSGCADNERLRITTSKGVSIHPIVKKTVQKYCHLALNSQRRDLVGNQRWVAALFLWYRADDR